MNEQQLLVENYELSKLSKWLEKFGKPIEAVFVILGGKEKNRPDIIIFYN